MDYVDCETFDKKDPESGLCIGNEEKYGEANEACNRCPAYLRYKALTGGEDGDDRTACG